MDFTEIIGFIIVLFVFLLPLLRKLLIDKKRVERQKQEEVEEAFIEEEEEEYTPTELYPISKMPPPAPLGSKRLVKRDYEFETDLESREYRSKITGRELETQSAPEFRERIVSESFILDEKKKVRKKKALASLIKKRDPGKAMVILSEILKRKFE